MRFSEIIEHLSERGFATRESWTGTSIIFYGLDNILHLSIRTSEEPCCARHFLNLSELLANDWIILPYRWNGTQDNFIPFERSDSTLSQLNHSGGHDIRTDVNPFLQNTEILLDARRKSIVAFTRHLFSEGLKNGFEPKIIADYILERHPFIHEGEYRDGVFRFKLTSGCELYEIDVIPKDTSETDDEIEKTNKSRINSLEF